VEYAQSGPGRRPHLHFDKGKPVLSQIVGRCEDLHAKHIVALLALLSNMQHLDPMPPVLRDYSSAREVRRLGERGENFAALVNTILEDSTAAAAYQSWLERLTPKDLDSITILRGALDEPLFALKFGGNVFAAPVLSDGTLRFAALTAAFFQPDMPQILVLEEIENGIHPTRLRLMVELLRERSSENGPQVVASTHSPTIVDWLDEETLEHCFLCRRDDATGISTVRPITELARFAKLIKRQTPGELFAEGWMENSG
jgi:predicted ATPase